MEPYRNFSYITASWMLSPANFLYPINNSFSTYSIACYCCFVNTFTLIATLALLMASLCIKIVLIASNKSILSFACCLWEAFCYADTSARKSCWSKTEGLVDNWDIVFCEGLGQEQNCSKMGDGRETRFDCI